MPTQPDECEGEVFASHLVLIALRQVPGVRPVSLVGPKIWYNKQHERKCSQMDYVAKGMIRRLFKGADMIVKTAMVRIWYNLQHEKEMK